MHEIEALADTCSVFRNGRHIETFPMGTKRRRDRALMIGREIASQFPPKPSGRRPAAAPHRQRPALGGPAQRRLAVAPGRGEIVGLGGLDGQGQKELLLALFGVLRGLGGEVTIDGKDALCRSPAAAKRGRRHGADPRGPQDRGADAADVDRRQPRARLHDACAPGRSSTAARSAGGRAAIGAAADQDRRADRRRLDAVGRQPAEGRHRQVADDRSTHHPPQRSDPRHRCRHEAGDLPPAARARRRRRRILFYSTDYEELIGCCDRVAVMFDGRIRREFEGEDINESNIVASALTIDTAKAARNPRREPWHERLDHARHARGASARDRLLPCATIQGLSAPSRSSSYVGLLPG